jgi:hypothetical protein
MWVFLKTAGFFAVVFALMCLPDLVVKYVPAWILLPFMGLAFAGLIWLLVWVVKQIVNSKP